MLDKAYRPDLVEQKLYAEWVRDGLFAADPGSNAKPYTIMMPPPNVTGSLHMGHALTFTLQDTLIRYFRRTGRDALWQPGTDHAGIATQMVVERMLAKDGVDRRDLGRDAFVEKVWEWKAQSGGTIINQLHRLGSSADWPRERFTLDEGLSAAVVKVFVQLHKEGLLYRDKRLVNWDPKLQTAISDLEVEQKEVKGNLWYFRYPVEGEDGRFITVATTRPETMLGDTGIAVNPSDERYADLVGKFAIQPVTGRRVRIVADDYADPEHGSGAVKITPAHDFNDFEVGRRAGLTLINILDPDARILAEFEVIEGQGVDARRSGEAAPEGYAGLDRFVARDKIIADMEGRGLLEKIEPITHSVPYGDRGGVPLEPLLTDQWYVDAKTLAQPALAAVREGKTRFVPKQWENTYFDWLENIQPWCVSRQLWWGHRIPAWYGPEGKIFVEETEEAAQAAARAHFGKDVDLVRDGDVLDTWFSSALWPFSTLGWPEKTPELNRYYPGDVLVTGFDIIFFWVARMMMFGIHFMGDVPFRDIYIHALVRDEHGQKMSKSKGNVIDPLELADRYGVDALRFTLMAMAAQGRDIKLAESRVEGYRNFCTKLWNASRYCEMNEAVTPDGFDPASVKLTVNRWIIGALARTAKAAGSAIEEYRFNDAAGALYSFAWKDFCDWYLEFTKPILNGEDEAAKAETRATTGFVLDQILSLLNPMMPFITEEITRHRKGEGPALMTAAWPLFDAALEDAAADAEMGWVVDVISTIRAVRSEMNVPPGAELQALIKDAGPEVPARLEAHSALIRKMARLGSIEVMAGEAPRGSAQCILGSATIVLPLEGHIDIAAERARLAKEMAKEEQGIVAIDRKLANPSFVEKAPPEVVETQHERKAEHQARLEKLKEALARLG
jgi:valyl-tRNA synthetase